MNLLTWLTEEQVAAAAVTILLQVTFVLAVACTIACLIRRNAVARHAVCLAGLVLAVACPLLAANGGAFGWTWLRVDWPVEEMELSDTEMEPPAIEEPPLNADLQFEGESSTRLDIGLLTGDLEASTTESITVPPDVLYRPGDVTAQDDSEVNLPLENPTSTSAVSPESVESSPLIASAPVVAAPTENTKVNFATILRMAVGYGLIVWLLGVLVQTGRWWIGARRLKSMLHGMVALDQSQFGDMIAEAAAVVRLRRPPKVQTGPLVPIPLVYGVLRPRVLLPRQFVQEAKPSEVQDVLVHEFAHVARGDSWISLLQRLAAVLYWPHPLVHLLSRQLSAAREEVCDNYVLREGRRTEFAEMLLTLSEQVQAVRIPVGLLGLVSRGRLESRVAGLLDRRRRTETRLQRRAVALLVVSGSLLLGLTAGIRAERAPSRDIETTSAVEPFPDDPGSDEPVAAGNLSSDEESPEDDLKIARRPTEPELTAETRRQILSGIEDSKDDAERQTRLRQAQQLAEELLLDGDHGRADQLNAAILLASLNARSATEVDGSEQPAVPFVSVHPLLLTLLQDESRSVGVRLWAAMALGRICRDADSQVSGGELEKEQREQIALALVRAVEEQIGKLATEIDSTSDPNSLPNWLEMRLVEALAGSGVSGEVGQRVVETFIRVTRQEDLTLYVRGDAAKGLGQIPVGRPVDFAPRLTAIAKMALALAEAAVADAARQDLRRAAGNIYFAFKPVSEVDRSRGWGLLTQASRFEGDEAAADVERLYQLVLPIITGITRHVRIEDVKIEPADVMALEGWLAERDQDDSDQTSDAPARDGSAAFDRQSVIDGLSQRCRPWINTPGEQLRSLEYTYTLGNDERRVELVRGVSEVERSMWCGSTLTNGLHWLLRHPERFDVTRSRLESEADRLEMTIRSKPDTPGIGLEIGNGISGSWRGYFTHGSNEMTLVVDAVHLLPLHEIHKFGGDPKITQIDYLDWQRVSNEGWIPRRVDVTHGGAVYHMHFAWQGGAAWLLTDAETEYQGNTLQVAQVSNVVVNDEELIQRSREEQRQREAAAGVVRTMLEHNRPWLDGDFSGMKSLSYTFHTIREDVQEQCVVTDDGTVVMQVTHDGQGKMGDRLGERQTALPSGEWARAQRDERFALIHDPPEQDRGQPFAEQLRHYGRIGCQFDLPLFRDDELLDGATVEIADGEWDDTPCRVATLHSPARDVYLGCGTMLGFTSWSYVHHIRPACETISIDRELNVPLHETLVSSRDNKRFEIDFGDYREVEPDQWAPLSIRIESPDYFTCELKFQLIEDRHWLLSEVQSWFDPENKSRGVVEDVRVNQPSELRDAALEQIEAARAVFGDTDDTVSQTVEVPAHPFVLGRKIELERLDVLFTIGRGGDLVARCVNNEARDSRDAPLDAVTVLVLDGENRLLSAARSKDYVRSSDGFEVGLSLGHSTGLSAASSFAVFLDGVPIGGAKAALRTFLSGVESPVRINVPDQLEGKTRAIGVAIEESDDKGLLARVDLVSRDTGLEFGLDVPICVFNAEGRLLSTGMKPGSLLVDGKIEEEQWTVELSPFDASRTASVVLGVTRGDVNRMRFGSRWMMLMDSTPIFSIEKLLSGETEETWWSGISQLAGQLNNDSMLEEFLHDPDRRTGERVQPQRRQELLAPHVERLAFIAGHAGDPQLVAAAARMVGFAGDRAQFATLLPLLEAGDALVRDAAAVALGLLGWTDGLDRLREMLAMSPEELRDSHSIDLDLNSLVIPLRRWNNEWDDDILTALLMIGSDDAVRVAGEQVTADLPALELGTGDDEGKIVGGNPQRIARLWRLLGELKQASAVDYLTRSLSWLSDHEPVADAMNLQPLIIALVDYEEQMQDLLAERIRRGDYATIRVLKESRNPHYIPAAREMMRNQDMEAWTFRQGVSYLWSVGTNEALATMVELYEQGLPAERRARLWLCEALAHHGDDRGLPEAFDMLVAACAPEEPPEDADARRKWERERERAREYPLDVFERAKSASRIAVVEQHLETADVATQIACLAVLGTLRTALPDGVRDALERWSGLGNEEVATQATLLLQRD